MAGLYVRARAVFLTVDSAKVSGVVLSEPSDSGCGYDTPAFGLAKTQKEREQWAREAQEAAQELELLLVIVGEQWSSHGLSRAAYASLNASWGLWLAAFERCITMKHHIVRVDPQTWRGAVFGKRRPRDREGLKRLAVKYAEIQLKMGPNLKDDIAEAACLRVWAERSSDVHGLLNPVKKVRRKKAA